MGIESIKFEVRQQILARHVPSQWGCRFLLRNGPLFLAGHLFNTDQQEQDRVQQPHHSRPRDQAALIETRPSPYPRSNARSNRINSRCDIAISRHGQNDPETSADAHVTFNFEPARRDPERCCG